MRFPLPALLLAVAAAAGCASEPEPARPEESKESVEVLPVAEFTAERWEEAETARFWASSRGCVLFPRHAWSPVEYRTEQIVRGVVSMEDLVRILRGKAGIDPGDARSGSIEPHGGAHIVVVGPPEVHEKVVTALQSLKTDR